MKKESIVVEVIDGTKDEHLMNFDAEVLPMYRIKLKDSDGKNIDCYEDEVIKIKEEA